MLVETHSLKPYRQRVLGTYVLLEESLRLVGAEGAQIEAAIAADRASRPRTEILTLEAGAQAALRNPRLQGHRPRQLPLAGVGRRRKSAGSAGR